MDPRQGPSWSCPRGPIPEGLWPGRHRSSIRCPLDIRASPSPRPRIRAGPARPLTNPRRPSAGLGRPLRPRGRSPRPQQGVPARGAVSASWAPGPGAPARAEIAHGGGAAPALSSASGSVELCAGRRVHDAAYSWNMVDSETQRFVTFGVDLGKLTFHTSGVDTAMAAAADQIAVHSDGESGGR
jgi:hypothetical protein